MAPGKKKDTPLDFGSESNSGKIFKASSDRWEGLSSNLLLLLAQHLCRIRNRRLLFGGNLDPVLEHGPAGMCGLLVYETLAFLKEHRLKDFPSQQQLAHLVKANASTFGHFLAGRPGGKLPWISFAQLCMRYLAVGSNETVHPLFDRINDYFFRDYNPRIRDNYPPFFRPERARFGEPYTRTELAGEIEWIAAERELTQSPARLIWVSGNTTFLPTGPEGNLELAIRRAMYTGVQIQFIHHGPSAASNGLDELFRSDGSSPTPNLTQIDIMKRTDLPSSCWEFMNPALQFLYLEIQTNNIYRSDEIMFIIRKPGEHSRVDYGPLALEAHYPELAAFKSWMKRMNL